MDDLLAEQLRGPFRDAAEAVFYHGSTPWEVDEALVDFGFVKGPFEAEDDIGLDRAWAHQQANDAQRLPILPRMMELGKLGRKSGAGWYRYPGGGGKVDDPIVADLALEEAHFHRVTRSDFTADEICSRMLSALVLAAQNLADQGYTEAQINKISIDKLGFPKHWGGVLVWAQDLGLARLNAMIRQVRLEGKIPLRSRSK